MRRSSPISAGAWTASRSRSSLPPDGSTPTASPAPPRCSTAVSRLLWRGRRTAIPRHQTLSAALSWSYDLLPAAESATLRGLSVFVGPFTLEAALAVASMSGHQRAGSGRSDLEPAVEIPDCDLACGAATEISPARYDPRLRGATSSSRAEKRTASRAPTPNISATSCTTFPLKSTGMQSAGGFLPYADHLPNVRAALTWSFSEAGDRARRRGSGRVGGPVLPRADVADRMLSLDRSRRSRLSTRYGRTTARK